MINCLELENLMWNKDEQEQINTYAARYMYMQYSYKVLYIYSTSVERF